MRQPYTSGEWIVKPGREAEFIAAWHEMAAWSAREIPGALWGRLLQDRDRPNRFLSFGPWASLEAIDTWRAHPGFAEGVGRIRPLLESLQPSTLELVAEVG